MSAIHSIRKFCQYCNCANNERHKMAAHLSRSSIATDMWYESSRARTPSNNAAASSTLWSMSYGHKHNSSNLTFNGHVSRSSSLVPRFGQLCAFVAYRPLLPCWNQQKHCYKQHVLCKIRVCGWWSLAVMIKPEARVNTVQLILNNAQN